VMVNRDKSDESASEEKARDVAASLDEATEPLGGTSNMESHAKVGYTEHNVEERAQKTAEEEGVTLLRNPDGSHTAIDESNAAEVTPGSGSKESGVASSTPVGSAPSAVAPGAGAAVGSTSGIDEGDHEKSRPAVAPGAGAAVGNTSDSDNGTNEIGRASCRERGETRVVGVAGESA